MCRRLHGHYWDLNSTKARPDRISEFYLAAFLGQMSADGYSIFAVSGATLPPPLPAPWRDEPARFHRVQDLLTAQRSASVAATASRDRTRAAAASDPDLAAAIRVRLAVRLLASPRQLIGVTVHDDGA